MGRKRQSAYPYRSKDYHRDSNLRRKYGLTLEQWDQKFLEQGSVCAICSSKEPRGKHWHTDHNHVTGQIRSILCGWCNTAIGKFQESPEILNIAETYLLIWNYRDKGGIEDLRKAIHNLEILIELEENGRLK